MLDGGTLLVNPLYKQRKYAEPRAAAEEQVAYDEQRSAYFRSTGNGGIPTAVFIRLRWTMPPISPRPNLKN